MADIKRLTRAQLERIVGSDQDALRAIEGLFVAVATSTTTDLTAVNQKIADATLVAELGVAQALQAINELVRVREAATSEQQQIDALTLAPVSQADSELVKVREILESVALAPESPALSLVLRLSEVVDWLSRMPVPQSQDEVVRLRDPVDWLVSDPGTQMLGEIARLREVVDGLSAAPPLVDIVSAFVKTLLDDPTAAAFLTTLGVSAFVQTILDDADAAAVRTTISAQQSDVELSAIAGLTSAADRLPYFTGSGTAALATYTAFARSFDDDANASAGRATLEIGAVGGTAQNLGTAASNGSGTDIALANHVHKGFKGQDEGSDLDSGSGCHTFNVTGGGASGAVASGVFTLTVPGAGGASPGDIVWSAASTRSGALLCDGSAVSRTTYAALFAAICKTGTGNTFDETTDTVTATAHGLSNGDPVQFYTSGALPTGLTEGTVYYLINKATDTFQVATAVGGSAINMTGNESGSQSWISAPFGNGDGETATTFNVPDIRGRVVAGKESSESRITNSVSGFRGDTLGAAGGSQSHTLTLSEIPSHSHLLGTTLKTAGAHSNMDFSGASSVETGGSTDVNGGGTAHRNVQPTIILNAFIVT